MTYLEKLKFDYPQIQDSLDYITEFCRCPDDFGYINAEDIDVYCRSHNCDECWAREMPESTL